MTTQQKQMKKRKLREEKSKKLRLSREKVSALKRQENNAEYHKQQRVRRFQRDMGKLNAWSEDILMKVNDSTLTQLEKNVNVLKALEEEYETERSRKRNLNESLESEGLKTLESKISALHQKLVQDQQAAGQPFLNDMGITGEAGVKFKPNKPAKDVAEVQVIRAPVAEVELIKAPVVELQE